LINLFNKNISQLNEIFENFLILNTNKFHLANGIHALNIYYNINKVVQDTQPTKNRINNHVNKNQAFNNQDWSKYNNYVFPNKKTRFV
jgi:hypothetical protein